MKVVVIGNGMVGQRFLEKLIERGGGHEITVFCEEPRPAYDRVQLTSFFSGKTAADLSLFKKQVFEEAGITLRLNDAVLSIDLEGKTVRSARYRDVPYDKLVIATGSSPFVPPVPGRDRRDCFVYRTIEDLEVITARAARARVGTVIGGGLLGLEAAKALHDLGLQTHVVEFAPRLMAVQLDDSSGRLLRRKVEALGATVHVSKNTKEITQGEKSRNRLLFTDGTSLETDIIVFSAGIRPRDELARAAGLAVGERGGIRIDSQCRTTNPDVYAVGECALWQGRVFGLVAPGYQMAEVAARHIAGEPDVQFLGADMSTKLKLMGVDVCSIGDAHAAAPGALSYVYTDEIVYKKLIVSEDRKQLLGAILVGDASDYGTLLQMVLNPLPLPEHPEELILPSTKRLGPEELGVESAPRFSAGLLLQQRLEGNHLRRRGRRLYLSRHPQEEATKAATSCGGCGPLAKQILDAEMKKRGFSVNNHLCEHFAHSRQELFHLVKTELVEELRPDHHQARTRPRLRHLQAGGRLDPRLLLERDGAQAPACAAAGHQRPFPRQPAEGRHLLDRAARARRRDPAREAGGARPGGEEVRALHQDHRRAAHRPLRRARRAAAEDLEGADRRRLRVRPRLRQSAAHGEVLRRHHLVPLRRAGLGVDGDPHRAALPRPARAAQDQDGGVGLHARVRRGAGQGRRRDRHREGLEPLRVRQRRHEAEACSASCERSHR